MILCDSLCMVYLSVHLIQCHIESRVSTSSINGKIYNMSHFSRPWSPALCHILFIAPCTLLLSVANESQCSCSMRQAQCTRRSEYFREYLGDIELFKGYIHACSIDTYSTHTIYDHIPGIPWYIYIYYHAYTAMYITTLSLYL